MKVALYCRVSSGDQETGNQVMALRQEVARRGWELAGVYQEEESAWRGGHQAELARAFQDGRRGQYQVLLVWALDRLSREGALAILLLMRRFRQARVKIISLQEAWTEVPSELEEVLLALTGWVARMESQRRSERTRAGTQGLQAPAKRDRPEANTGSPI